MLIPFSWLSQYVDITLAADELAHRLTMGGIEVGDVLTRGGWEGCVVGHVRATRPHPNADTLTLCEVDPGDGPPMEVVCGAPNVAAGQKICFARPGVMLKNMHNGRREELKPATIRGIVSEGMICSEAELEISDEHQGIIVLPDDAEVGTPLDEVLGDTFLELELTPNRGDCLSMLGVAREIGAITGQPVRAPETGYAESDAPVETLARVTIEDPDLCFRYTASVLTGISIGPSPQWLQERLNRAGLRPINNVVDVTNYVMLEFNQPLHAFDLDTVVDRHVVVRRAAEGEEFTTLDGVKRKLSTDNLLIADPTQAIGIGGVMGGANSEITAGTTNMLLESATFHPLNNRRTSTDLGLRTEASLRFEKGLRPELAPIALRRATQLILETAGGQAASGIIDVFPVGDTETPAVPLTAARLRQVLGMDLDIARAETVLASLGITTRRTGPDSLEADPPYWRSDIAIEEDLIEEVIRIIGYDEVPTTMLSSPIPYHQANPMMALKDGLRDALSGAGMQETISYPLVSVDDLNRLSVNGESGGTLALLRVANPMSVEQDIMRPTLAASILNTLAYNRGHNDGGFRLFEMGRAFIPQSTGLPVELEMVAGVMSGPRYDANWLSTGEPLDFFDLSGTLATALQRVGIAVSLESHDHTMFHPGRCARVAVDAGRADGAGLIGELHPDIREAFDLGSDAVVYFEVKLDDLLEAGTKGGRFESLSRFPAANRDLALVAPADVPAARVQGLIERVRLVERAELFDVYTGESLPEGTRSLAFRIRFRAPDRTLTAEDVNRAVNGLTRALEREAGATVRT
jgi:phenylalanyl-tRNA synthetase beta chain